jgi:hypothetical protein
LLVIGQKEEKFDDIAGKFIAGAAWLARSPGDAWPRQLSRRRAGICMHVPTAQVGCGSIRECFFDEDEI